MVEVDKNVLTIKAYKQDGTLIDSYSIDKENPAKSSLTLAPARSASGRFSVYGDIPSQAGGAGLSIARLIDEKWYVNAKVFMGCIGGGATLSSGTVELFYEGRNMKVPPEKTSIIKEKKAAFITPDVLKQFVGFDYYYDEGLNLLVFAK